MQQEFELWLGARVSEERKALILDAFELLATLLDLRVWDSAVNVISASEKLDTATCLADLAEELRAYCIQTCLQYGITLDEEQYGIDSQALVNKLLMTLTHVDAWEDGTRILAICESDESPEEILAGLCEEISGVDVEEILPLLKHVDVEKINVLINLYREGVGEPDLAKRSIEERAIVMAKRYTGNPVADWILQGGAIGLEFRQYVELLSRDFLSNRDVTVHAKAWVLMGICSGTVEADLLYTQCVSMFDETYQNLESQTKVSRAIRAILGELS